MKLTNASSESADFEQSLKSEREVSSEGKAEESQKRFSTVETSPSKAKPSNSIDEFFDGLLSGKSMNEMLFDSPPEDEATYIPPNDSQLFSPSHTPFENIRLAFVECCPSLPAPKEAKSWTEKRKRTVKSRWKKNPSMDFWYGFFHKIEDSDLPTTHNEQRTTVLKILVPLVSEANSRSISQLSMLHSPRFLTYHYGSHATRVIDRKVHDEKSVSIPLWFSRNVPVDN